MRSLDVWSPSVDAAAPDLPDADVPRDLPDADVPRDLPDADVPRDLPDADVPRDLPDADVPRDLPDDLPDVAPACLSDAGRCEGFCADAVCERPVGAAGNDNATCAWMQSGAVYCWGSNGFFASAADDVLRPTRVAALTDPVTEVALATYYLACAVTRAGRLLCWSNGASAAVRTPREVFASGVRRVVAGEAHVCALHMTGHVTCSGSNYFGQLGRGSRDVGTESRTDFARVVTAGDVELTDVVDLAAGSAHACARRRDGTVWCWGGDKYAQLGSGARATQRCGERAEEPCSTVARPVTGLSLGTSAPAAQSMALGLFHSCVRRDDGSVACWGRADPYGFSPSPPPFAAGVLETCSDAPCRPSPLSIPALAGVQRIIAGRAYTCVLRSHPSAPVVCWGAEFDALEGVAGVSFAPSALAAGYNHSCAISSGGAMSCWGYGEHGQIAHATALRPVATRVAEVTSATNVAAGPGHTCALVGGEARCWGTNNARQLGDGTHVDRGRPVAVLDLTDARQIAVGEDHTCARRGDGTLWCWGNYADGQLGPLRTDRMDPEAVLAEADGGVLTGVRAVALGTEFSCVLRSASVECWGRNQSCQTGVGFVDAGVACAPRSQAPRTAVRLPIGAPEALAVTSNHVCVREGVDDGGVGAVACWGENYVGQANPAMGTIDLAAAPARIALPGAATDVSAGVARSCAVIGGAVYCWGDERRPTTAPRMVIGAGVAAVRSGGNFDCAVLTAGRAVRCWGVNARGQLGDGTLVDRSVPVPVLRAEGTSPVPLDGVRELTLARHHACALRDDGTVWCWGSDLLGQLGQGNVRRLSAAAPIVW